MSRQLFSFMMTSVNGYFETPDHSLEWGTVDKEFDQYSISQLNDIGLLIFGRVTYEGMAAYWTTEEARNYSPEITAFMNDLPKLVVSTTAIDVSWNNTKLLSNDLADEVAALKEQPGKDIAIFGSSRLTTTLIEEGLVDEVRVIVSPVLLDAGRPLFDDLRRTVRLELLRSTSFRNGNVLNCYRPRSA